MIRPRPQDILKPLKPFQRRTVDHAFRRLFLDADSTSRFLVADEVGLGKTLVARGIIARAIDHLWEDVDRIDIVYICSNAGIAREFPQLGQLVSEDGEYEPCVDFGVAGAPGLETPVLIVLDQAVIRVAGKGERVEPEGVDRGLCEELQTGTCFSQIG